MSERIGFIGLGNMGRPMAGQVIAKGFSTTVFDLSEAPMAILRQKGATRAASSPAVLANSDVIVTMLPNTPDVQGVVLGEGGLLDAGRPGMLHIDMSTIDPLASKAMAAALAAKGIGWVDAGVGRSPAHADRGESSFARLCVGPRRNRDEDSFSAAAKARSQSTIGAQGQRCLAPGLAERRFVRGRNPPAIDGDKTARHQPISSHLPTKISAIAPSNEARHPALLKPLLPRDVMRPARSEPPMPSPIVASQLILTAPG